jgi:hypothetical protein
MTSGQNRRRRGHPRYERIIAALTAVALVAIAASPAIAQGPLPGDNAGTGQYVEPVPDAGGDRPANPGGGHGRGGQLPAGTRNRLPAGEEGRTLERLATDSGSGAPGSDSAGRKRSSGHSAGPGASDEAARTAASAVTSAAVGDDGPGIPVLLIALVALTAGIAAAGLRARKRRS